MYIPYFRGKQFDLLALKEIVADGLLTDSIVPLIEPVRDSAHLRKTLEVFIKNKREILVIYNPEVGQVQRGVIKIHEIIDLFENPYITPVYILNRSFNSTWIKQEGFVFLSKNYLKDVLAEANTFKPKYHIITDSARLRRAIPDNRVLLTDPFTRFNNGTDYLDQELEDEFYSDDLKYIRDDGYIGYSNYGIDGEAYFDKGYPSQSIVLHILYLDKHKNVRIKHFVSDSNDSAANPAEKFFEALKKLAEWHTRYKKEVPLTKGLAELLSYQERGTYPGTGTIKKLSVMHQLELFSRLG